MTEALVLDVAAVMLLLLLVFTGFGVVLSRNLFASVMLLGAFSFLMAVSFFLLDAADVALTEAAIGAGVSTVLLLATLSLTTEREKAGNHLLPILLLLAAVTGGLLVFTTLDAPAIGDPDAPAHGHVVPRYLEQGPEEVGIPNIVTAVLASYRGFDTLGEVIVVFTAGVGVLLMLGLGRIRREDGKRRPEAPGLIRYHDIPRIVTKLLIPFIMLFALYVQFHGEYSPGGGFQAGAIFAAAIMLYSLVEGELRSRRVVPDSAMLLLMSLGVGLYLAVGFTTLLLGGDFLNYSVLSEDPVAGQHLGILLIELGVGVTVAGVIVTIFHAFASRRQR